MRDIYISKAKNDEVSIALNGVKLLSKIEMDTMKKTFGRSILRPMDDNDLANDIELVCQIAREAD